MKKRYAALDYLRAVAALLVILYHYTTRYGEVYGNSSNYPIKISFGFMAVSAFFVLSGFLITENLKLGDSAGRFLYLRGIRLYPSYWVGIVITSATVFFLLPEVLRPINIILINFTMLEGFIGIDFVDGVYWTLRIEVLFYILISIVILLGFVKHIKYMCLLTSLCCLLCNLSTSQSVLFKLMRYFLSPQYMHMFIAGMVISIWHKNINNIFSKFILILTMCVCIANQYITHEIGYLIFFLIVLIYLELTVKWFSDYSQPKTFIGKALRWIANISYPLYLIHQNIGYSIIRLLFSWDITNELFLVIPIAISILLAFLIQEFIDTPLNKRLRKVHIGLPPKFDHEKC